MFVPPGNASSMRTPPAMTARFRPKPGVLVRELEGEAVLLDLETGRYFGLNATGVRIWALLGGDEELGRIVDRLEGEYAPAETSMMDDILELCTALEREGLVARVG